MKSKEKDIEGIEADEHFVDMFKEIDLMYDNIKENTDNAFEILKLFGNNKDQESVDVLRITCSNILDCEEIIKKQIENFEKIKAEILKNEIKVDFKLRQKEVEDFYKTIKKYEKDSSSQFKELLKLSSNIK